MKITILIMQNLSKVSTHIASAISRDNPFVMLALANIQEAIVDDKKSF